MRDKVSRSVWKISRSHILFRVALRDVILVLSHKHNHYRKTEESAVQRCCWCCWLTSCRVVKNSETRLWAAVFPIKRCGLARIKQQEASMCRRPSEKRREFCEYAAVLMIDLWVSVVEVTKVISCSLSYESWHFKRPCSARKRYVKAAKFHGPSNKYHLIFRNMWATAAPSTSRV